MMGGRGGSDPRLAATSDVIGILRILADPAGAKALADQLEQVQKEVVVSLDAAHAKNDAELKRVADATAALKAREDAVAAREADLPKNEQAVAAAAAFNKQRSAELAEHLTQVDRTQAELVAAQAELKTARDNAEEAAQRRAQNLEAAHAARMAEAEASIGKREQAIRQREAAAEKTARAQKDLQASLDARETVLARGEAAAALVVQANNVLKEEIDAKMRTLRQIVS